MLNYIWVALIVLGIGAALTTDIINNSTDRYKNKTPIKVIISFNENVDAIIESKQSAKVRITSSSFNSFYDEKIKSDLDYDAVVNIKKDLTAGFISIKVDEKAPSIWKEIADASTEKGALTGNIQLNQKISDNSFCF